MSCCEDTKLDLVIPPKPADGRVGRRSLIRGAAAAGIAGLALGNGRLARAQNRQVKLAFCSQLLCVVPYEVTRVKQFFAEEGLDVELVYTRGGNAAMQALVGGAVDYAATSFDVALQAYARNAPIRRFATTGRLPLFALAAAPSKAGEIAAVEDLEDRTVGVSALGNADHTLLLYLLTQAGVDTDSVRFATLGPNLFDALRLGQVEAGMVQEPALTLIVQEGGRVLFNAMDIEDARRRLGGAYEFMGVTVRAEERAERLEEMRALARALEAGLRYQREAPVSEVSGALPRELLVGGDRERFNEIVAQYRGSLYPQSVAIDVEACRRVARAHKAAGILSENVTVEGLLDRTVVPS